MKVNLFILAIAALAWANPNIPVVFIECSSDQECIEAPASACDCGGLGKNISIRRDKKEQWLLKLKQSRAGHCLASISKDWSCWHFQNKCKKEMCTLEPLPIREFSKAKENDCDESSLDKVNRNACFIAVARRDKRLPLCLKITEPDTDLLIGGNSFECMKIIINEMPINLLKKSVCQDLKFQESTCYYLLSQKLQIPIEKLK